MHDVVSRNLQEPWINDRCQIIASKKVIENKIKQISEPDLGSDQGKKKEKKGSLKKKKETEEQLEQGRETEGPWEQLTVELMSNILQHHNLCHTPLLQEEFSKHDEEDDFIFTLKSLTTQQ